MRKLRDNISYIIGAVFLLFTVIDFAKLLLSVDGVDLLRYLPDILCFIGAIIFLLSNVLGIMPVIGEKKELIDGLVDYLHENDERSAEPFKVSEEIMDKLVKNKRDLEALSLLAKDIVSYCDVDVTNLTIKNQEDLVGAAGTFTISSNEINISLTNTRTENEVIAVLIHECMHYILKEKDLWLEDIRENEFLTDIACLYYGFGEYLNRGYIMVGYLKRHEIGYARRKLKREKTKD